MPEPNYKPELKKRNAHNDSMVTKAKKQIARIEALIEEQESRRPVCKVCRVQNSDANMIYMVEYGIYVCKVSEDSRCWLQAWNKLPHDKRWDE